jgi:catechol 2,3-dioxygenase-like lactoylglutathione lyase family enzyme
MFKITDYEHVGIRVTDRERSVRFYEKLGFRVEKDLPEHQANEMISPGGVYLNLIFNGVPRPENRNILMDEPVKYPGITHPAFIVENFDALLAMFERENIRVTEGPIDIGGRRRACFVRDPDGNVLEFDELYAD